MFSKIESQNRPIATLRHIISSNNIGGSYLFYGTEGVGKFTTAREFAKAINCSHPFAVSGEVDACDNCASCRKITHFTHPDVEIIFPTPNFERTSDGEYKKEKDRIEIQKYLEQLQKTPYQRYYFSKSTAIRIDTIRDIEQKIYFAPSEAKYKVFIILDSDQMTHQAANAFLKTLEEPPEYAVIILVTRRLSALLPTIISRCKKIQFYKVPSEKIQMILIKQYNIPEESAKVCARMGNGNVAKAIMLAKSEQFEAHSLTFQFIESLINKDFKQVHELSNQFSYNRNKELLTGVFDFLTLWFHDLVAFIHSPGQIVNQDRQKLLEDFYNINHLSEKDIHGLIDMLTAKQRLIEGHINFELLFIDTFFQIYKQLYKTT
jgi:DNA polymerase-3 subunit delta'